ncbi:hypothetical protein V6N13_070640 [Hibiscus sabdariffa]|uniref:At2g35280-like TPR domain-containing protein n=1 Tax=Hibiscus sabdariffa TaxID=183260 RepID=A0ABR2TG54_9ROSI
MAKEQKMHAGAGFLNTLKASTPLRPFLFALSARKPRTRNQIKRNRKNKTNPFPTIFSLPNELIAEVLARVAAISASDLFNVVLRCVFLFPSCVVFSFMSMKNILVLISCKVFHRIAGDDYILRHVSLEKFPVIPWGSTEQAFFLDKCKRSGHPEALYREGVVCNKTLSYFPVSMHAIINANDNTYQCQIGYFSFGKVEEGLNCLNNAAKVGHLGASYVLGVILLCVEETEEEGRRLLNYVKSESGIRESRKKLKDIVSVTWRKMSLKPKSNSCPMQGQHRRRGGWPGDSDDEVDCEACGCHLEVIFVCSLLRGIITY